MVKEPSGACSVVFTGFPRREEDPRRYDRVRVAGGLNPSCVCSPWLSLPLLSLLLYGFPSVLVPQCRCRGSAQGLSRESEDVVFVSDNVIPVTMQSFYFEVTLEAVSTRRYGVLAFLVVIPEVRSLCCMASVTPVQHRPRQS